MAMLAEPFGTFSRRRGTTLNISISTPRAHSRNALPPSYGGLSGIPPAQAPRDFSARSRTQAKLQSVSSQSQVSGGSSLERQHEPRRSSLPPRSSKSTYLTDS